MPPKSKDTKAKKSAKSPAKSSKNRTGEYRSYSKYEFHAYDANGLVMQKRIVIQNQNGEVSGYVMESKGNKSVVRPITHAHEV